MSNGVQCELEDMTDLWGPAAGVGIQNLKIHGGIPKPPAYERVTEGCGQCELEVLKMGCRVLQCALCMQHEGYVQQGQSVGVVVVGWLAWCAFLEGTSQWGPANSP